MVSLLTPARAAIQVAGTTASGLRLIGQGIQRPGAYGGPGFSARVVLDSISPAGARITTMEWRYPRFIHAEIMTYRMFSRNSASSRAIPVQKLLEQVILNPAGPVWWGKAQAGMQAHEQLTGWKRTLAQDLWYGGRYAACAEALINHKLGLHKQVTNRGIEKWMWITVIITASPVAFENVWRQRCHIDAQPEFQRLAYLARSVYNGSVPTERTLHAPFMRFEDEAHLPLEVVKRVSTARAARVSYLTHDGIRDYREDLRLYRRLHLDSSDEAIPHTSPAEHVLAANEDPLHRSGNAFGWDQHREEVDPYFIHYFEDEAA